MNPIRFVSKDAFIHALESRREFWREYDALRTKEHLAAEKAWLEKTRATLKERLKWSYEDWKKKEGTWSASVSLGRYPECPILMEASIDKVLASLKFSYSKSFTVDENGQWAMAYKLLTWDPYAKTTVC